MTKPTSEKLIPGNYPSEFDIFIDSTVKEPPREEERKHEILIAGDLRRFTETMEYLQKYADPVDIVPFLNRLFEAVAQEAKVQDGSINKYLGDGFLIHYEIKNPTDLPQILNRILLGIYDIINVTFPQLRDNYKHTKLGLSIVISRVPDVIWARIGGPSYTDYSMVDKSVNQLFRALDFAKGNLILVSDDLGQYLHKNWILVDLGKQSLDGILRRIELFSVLRPKTDEEESDNYKPCIRKCSSYYLCKIAYDRGRHGGKLINCQHCMRTDKDPICWHWQDCNVKNNYGKAKGSHDNFTCCHMCIHFKSCFHSYFLGRFKKNMIWCGKPHPA